MIQHLLILKISCPRAVTGNQAQQGLVLYLHHLIDSTADSILGLALNFHSEIMAFLLFKEKSNIIILLSSIVTYTALSKAAT